MRVLMVVELVGEDLLSVEGTNGREPVQRCGQVCERRRFCWWKEKVWKIDTCRFYGRAEKAKVPFPSNRLISRDVLK